MARHAHPNPLPLWRSLKRLWLDMQLFGSHRGIGQNAWLSQTSPWVYCKCEVVEMQADLYNHYARQGLLDPNHTIGWWFLLIFFTSFDTLPSGKPYVPHESALTLAQQLHIKYLCLSFKTQTQTSSFTPLLQADQMDDGLAYTMGQFQYGFLSLFL